MNFIEAVTLMRRGKLLKRESYNYDHHYCLYIDEDDGDESVSYYLRGEVQATEWVFSLSDFEANDWVILDN